MKDKRHLLKISAIMSYIFIAVELVYYLFFNKLDDKVITEIFLLIIALFFALNIHKESHKSILDIKKSKAMVVISSIYLFIEFIIPGILGFVFLSSIGNKKKKELPQSINYEKSTLTYIMSIISILVFLLVMFVLPNFDVFNKIPLLFTYLFMFILIVVLNFKYYYNDAKLFFKNLKKYIPFVLKRYLIMFITYACVGAIIVLINNGQQAQNQQLLNKMFLKLPILTAILSCLYAPIVEEGIFRLELGKLINNKTVFVVISGLVFGLLHVVNVYTKPLDLLYALVYGVMGINLAKAYFDSKNIFVSISMHFIQNTISICIMSLLLFR